MPSTRHMVAIGKSAWCRSRVGTLRWDHDQPARPSSGSPVLSARTPWPAAPDDARSEPARSSDAGTPACRVFSGHCGLLEHKCSGVHETRELHFACTVERAVRLVEHSLM